MKTIDNKTVASHSYEEEIKTDIPISVLREQAVDFKTDTIVLDEEKEDFNKMYNETFGVQIQNKKEDALVVENYSFADSKNFANRPNISMFEEEEKIPNYKYCGAVFSTYIIIEMKN